MSDTCKTCSSYNKGRGSKKCIDDCKEYSKITTRQGPCVEAVQISRVMLENLSIPLKTDYYNILNPPDAVILFLRYHLKLSLREIAEIQSITHQAVDSKIKRLVKILNTYRVNKL